MRTKTERQPCSRVTKVGERHEGERERTTARARGKESERKRRESGAEGRKETNTELEAEEERLDCKGTKRRKGWGGWASR